MAVGNGTITGATLLRANGALKTYLVTCNFGAYTGAADTATVTGLGAAILAKTRNGKTVTLRGALPIAPGLDTNAQAIYFTGTAVQAAAVSSDALTGQLSAADGTEATTATASKGVEICVIVDEA